MRHCKLTDLGRAKLQIHLDSLTNNDINLILDGTLDRTVEISPEVYYQLDFSGLIETMYPRAMKALFKKMHPAYLSFFYCEELRPCFDRDHALYDDWGDFVPSWQDLELTGNIEMEELFYSLVKNEPNREMVPSLFTGYAIQVYLITLLGLKYFVTREQVATENGHVYYNGIPSTFKFTVYIGDKLICENARDIEMAEKVHEFLTQ